MESDRSDEWMKPAVPEARRTRRIILLARVPTTFSRYTHTRARACARARRARTRLCEGEENPALIAVGEVDW